jgi:hypothetical protein
VKYLFFRLYPQKKKKGGKAKSKKREPGAGDTPQKKSPAKKEEAADGGEKDDRPALGLYEKLDRAIELKDRYLNLLSDPKLKKIINKTLGSALLCNMTLDVGVCGADAYEAAMNYGKVNAFVYNSISAARLLFPISVKTVDIACDFENKKSRFDGGVDIKLNLSRLLGAGILMLIWFVKNKDEIFKKS